MIPQLHSAMAALQEQAMQYCAMRGIEVDRFESPQDHRLAVKAQWV